MTSQISGNNITTTLVGGADLATLENVTVRFNGGNPEGLKFNDNSSSDIITNNVISTDFSAGDIITISKDKGQLVIAGTFSDGTEQVLFQKDFN